MKIYARQVENSYPVLDIEIFTDHLIFHSTDSEIAAAVDLTKYSLPQGQMISKNKNRVTQHMIDDFEAFTEQIEDLCEEDYNLILTYKNVSDDHSHYYNFLATDEDGSIIVDLRLRLRVSNHDAHSTKEQKQHKKEELASPLLHQLLSESDIAKLSKYVKVVVVNDEVFETYEDAFDRVNEVIQESVEVMKKNGRYRKKIPKNIQENT